mgnify:FL=1|tara:strand:- start:3835 stop:4041 length:207 start_codon:yes stop_codon:yes gene_type:complete
MLNRFDVLVLLASILSLFYSLYLWFEGSVQEALFVGLWVPSVLGFGIYIKLIRLRHFLPAKIMGTDKT